MGCRCRGQRAGGASIRSSTGSTARPGSSRPPVNDPGRPGVAATAREQCTSRRLAFMRPPCRRPAARSGAYQFAGKYQGRRYVYSVTNRFMTPASRRPRRLEQVLASYSSFDAVALPGQRANAAPPKCKARIFQYTEAGHTPHRRPVQAARGWQRTGGSQAVQPLLSRLRRVHPCGSPRRSMGPGRLARGHRRWERGAKAWLQQHPLPRRTASRGRRQHRHPRPRPVSSS